SSPPVRSARLSPAIRLLLFFLTGGAAAVTVGLAVVVVLLVHTGASAPEALLERYLLVLTCALLVPMAAIGVVFARRVDGRTMAQFGLGLDCAGGRWLATGLAAGLAATAALYGVLVATGAVTVHGLMPTRLLRAEAGPEWSLVALLLLFGVQSASEELIVRGYLLQNLVDLWGKPAAVVVSSVLFALLHGANPGAQPFALLNILLIGLLFALSYLRTGGLWFAIGLHWAWNFGLGALFSLPVSGCTIDGLVLTEARPVLPWLTGGDFGPEGGLAGTLAIALLTLVLARLTASRGAAIVRGT
ncbi:MAG: CPBP family intramembrane metalloprotease, partial [Armatimonadetes bacterium]|nr:CPBP family intramembrane metalloprotease [Armatimonadota bacterium]